MRTALGIKEHGSIRAMQHGCIISCDYDCDGLKFTIESWEHDSMSSLVIYIYLELLLGVLESAWTGIGLSGCASLVVQQAPVDLIGYRLDTASRPIPRGSPNRWGPIVTAA